MNSVLSVTRPLWDQPMTQVLTTIWTPRESHEPPTKTNNDAATYFSHHPHHIDLPHNALS